MSKHGFQTNRSEPASRIRPPNDENLILACKLLGEGKLVAVPTETVYGLAANALNPKAVNKIFVEKGRPSNNPLIVHLTSIEQMNQVVSLPLESVVENQFDRLSDLWPGPLTLILPRGRSVPDNVTAGHQTVAIRIPAHPVIQSLLHRLEFPIAAPSANRSNYVSPTTAQHCDAGLSRHVQLILDGGPCRFGVESTIVLLDAAHPRVLRPGGVSCEVIAERLGVDIETLTNRFPRDVSKPLAPGQLAKHYSPKTKLLFVDSDEPANCGSAIGRIAFMPLAESESTEFEQVEVLSQSGNLNEVAQNLFGAIRKLDQIGLDCILIDRCQRIGIGRAIMDRLDRAVAQ